MTRPCECGQPGWCERHKFTKPTAIWRLCQSRADYRRAWDRMLAGDAEDAREDDAAPYVSTRRRRLKAGDLIAAATAHLGLKPCGGCKRRQDKLNQWISIPLPGVEEDREIHEVDLPLPPSFGTHDPEVALAITTAPRPQPSILRSFASVAAAGFNDILLVAEPGSTVPRGVRVHAWKERQGAWPTWCHTLRLLADWKPNAKIYGIFQDDVLCCRGLRDFLVADLWFDDTIGLVSPYRSTGKMVQRQGRRVWNPSELYIDSSVVHPYRQRTTIGNVLWGACTYLFPRRSLDIWLAHPEMIQLGGNLLDLKARRYLTPHGLHCWYYKPSLAQHIEGPSSLKHGFGRGMYAEDFVGEEFDARNLHCPPPVACRSACLQSLAHDRGVHPGTGPFP